MGLRLETSQGMKITLIFSKGRLETRLIQPLSNLKEVKCSQRLEAPVLEKDVKLDRKTRA
jgi:hypothetical protein